jgi:hypothetical protein
MVGPPRGRTRGPGSQDQGGIDEALGSPSVLPKEGTSDRPLVMFLHGNVATGGLGSSANAQSSERAARDHERATGVSEARPYEATSANNRGPDRAVRPKRATTS